MSIVPNPNADFSPAGGVYTELKPFRFWCQKVLPLVYDDSLSYYELLCKVVDYLNKTMEDVDNAVTEVQALHAAYDLLEAYVNDYFNALDVQQEINNKLDAMAQSGALSALISPFVEEWLPGVVEEQIPGVVSNQIGATVAGQIGNTVAQQIDGVVAGQISPVVEDWLDENITPTTPAVDASLSIAGAAADAKATGDYDNYLKRAISGVYSEQELSYSGTDGDYYINVTNGIDNEVVATHGAITYTDGNTSFFIGAYDSTKTLISELTRELGNQAEKTATYSIPSNAYYLRVVFHSTVSVDVDLTIKTINSFEKVDGELNKYYKDIFAIHNNGDFESGSWENNVKTNTEKRIRLSERVDVVSGDIVIFSSDSNLYFNVSVYASASETQISEYSGWRKTAYVIANNGVMCLNVANAATFTDSTTILPSDLHEDIIIIRTPYRKISYTLLENYENAVEYMGFISTKKYVESNIDTTFSVPTNASYLLVQHGDITYSDNLTSFAVQDVTSDTVTIIREYGSNTIKSYYIPITENITNIRIVQHTTGTPYPLYVSFVKNSTLIEKVIPTIPDNEWMISNNDTNTKSFVYCDGIPVLFKYSSKHLGGVTIQDVQHSKDGTYVLSSENDGIAFVDNYGGVTFKTVTAFGHGISVQELANGNLMVASADENYGTESVKRNIYHYNFSSNSIIDYFTPDLDGKIMYFAWQITDNSYYIFACESGTQNITLYLYNSSTNEKSIVGRYAIPSTYIQGGCVLGRYAYVSCNDGWDNTGDSYILVFDVTNFTLIKTITLTGMFKEVEGVSIYESNGNIYAKFGESHLVQLFDIKLN